MRFVELSFSRVSSPGEIYIFSKINLQRSLILVYKHGYNTNQPRLKFWDKINGQVIYIYAHLRPQKPYRRHNSIGEHARGKSHGKISRAVDRGRSISVTLTFRGLRTCLEQAQSKI